MRRAVAVLLLLVAVLCAQAAGANCFENWSRCTPQTAFATDVLWKSCPEYCQKCRGVADGTCKKVNTTACSGGYQCKCLGNSVPKSTSIRDVMTCALGL